jgi:hypothetical protein
MTKMTEIDARTTIENQFNQSLAAIGSKAKFTYKAGGQTAQINAPGPVELTVDTSIKDNNTRKSIIDPIKDYMVPAKIATLTVNDTPRHRTWTYTASLPVAPTGPEDNGLGPDPNAPRPQVEQPAPTAVEQPAQAPVQAPAAQAPVQEQPAQAPAQAPAQTAPNAPANSSEQQLDSILQGH